MSQSPVESTGSNGGTTAGARPQQRRFARAAVAIPAMYVLEGQEAKAGGEIVNLGGGGVRIAASDDLERGQQLTVNFTLPDLGRDIVARGKVVLSFYEGSSSRYAHGVAFTQISSNDQAAIVGYVESLQHESADL